jgi:hypothetical protein
MVTPCKRLKVRTDHQQKLTLRLARPNKPAGRVTIDQVKETLRQATGFTPEEVSTILLMKEPTKCTAGFGKALAEPIAEIGYSHLPDFDVTLSTTPHCTLKTGNLDLQSPTTDNLDLGDKLVYSGESHQTISQS